MQKNLLWIFTEKDIENNFFLNGLQNSENAIVFLVKNGTAEILEKNETVSLSKNSIIFVEPTTFNTLEKRSSDFQLFILIYKKSFLSEVNIKLNKLKIFKYFSQYFKEFSNFPDKEMQLLLIQIESKFSGV